MKTHLLYGALDDLYEIARLGDEYRAAVDEMLDNGLLIDSGNLLETEMIMLNRRQRIALMDRVSQEGWLRVCEPPCNLVFVFKADFRKQVGCLLHAVDLGDGWRLRMIFCNAPGAYVPCPIEGHLDYGCTGLSVGAWPLGGNPKQARRDTSRWLLDIALTGFSRMRRPMTRQQAQNRMLPLTSALSAAWAGQANLFAGND